MSSSSRPIILFWKYRPSLKFALQNIFLFSFENVLMSFILSFLSSHSILKLLASIFEHLLFFSKAFHFSSPLTWAGGTRNFYEHFLFLIPKHSPKLIQMQYSQGLFKPCPPLTLAERKGVLWNAEISPYLAGKHKNCPHQRINILPLESIHY